MTRSLLLLPLTGCFVIFGDGNPITDDWQLQTFADEGDVCFVQGDGGVDVTIVLNDCMSSSCSRDFAGSCEAVVEGSTITLTSDMSWEQNVAVGAMCTDDCGIPQADCTISGLADGTYEVTFGDQTVTLTVPVDNASGCGLL